MNSLLRSFHKLKLRSSKFRKLKFNFYFYLKMYFLKQAIRLIYEKPLPICTKSIDFSIQTQSIHNKAILSGSLTGCNVPYQQVRFKKQSSKGKNVIYYPHIKNEIFRIHKLNDFSQRKK